MILYHICTVSVSYTHLTAYSLSIRDGADSGAATMKSVYKAGLTEEEWLESIYAAETAKHPSQSNRWSNLQLTAARSGGTVFPMNGTLGALLSSSGEMYHDYVKDWIEEHKNDLSKKMCIRDRAKLSKDNPDFEFYK